MLMLSLFPCCSHRALPDRPDLPLPDDQLSIWTFGLLESSEMKSTTFFTRFGRVFFICTHPISCDRTTWFPNLLLPRFSKIWSRLEVVRLEPTLCVVLVSWLVSLGSLSYIKTFHGYKHNRDFIPSLHRTRLCP
jgi:hypothetical protein